MEDEVAFEYEGKIYSANFIVQGDNLVVYLPDGSQRETVLRGLDPELAAMTHLRGFVLHPKRKV